MDLLKASITEPIKVQKNEPEKQGINNGLAFKTFTAVLISFLRNFSFILFRQKSSKNWGEFKAILFHQVL